ncbi:MAG: zinc-ribbon domain-containing protein [Sphaerochaeta sp.]
MAYCVQCGVKLADGATRCPLCGTEVVLPPTMQEKAAEPLFAKRLPQEGTRGITKAKKGLVELIVALFVVGEITVGLSLFFSGALAYAFIPLFSIAMAALSLVAIVLARPHYIYHASAQSLIVALFLLGLDGSDVSWGWSLIAAGGILLYWFLGVFPWTAWAKKRTGRALTISGLSAVAYLALVNSVVSGSCTWFWPVAVPTVLALSLGTIIFLVWFTHRKGSRIPIADIVLGSMVVLFFSAAVFDLSLSRYATGLFALRWATSLLVSGVIILLFLVAVSLSLRLRRYFTSHNRHD